MLCVRHSEDGSDSQAASEVEEAGTDQGPESEDAAEDAQLQDRKRSHQAAGPAGMSPLQSPVHFEFCP